MDRPGTTLLGRTIARLMFLPTVIAAFAILVKGYAEAGDGFSAGVVAALGVLLQYLMLGRVEAEKLWPVRRAGRIGFFGLLVSLLLAVAPLLFGEPVLTHYPLPGEPVVYVGSLELITPVLFDVGVFLLVFGFVVGSVGAFARTINEEEEYAGPAGGRRR